MKNLHKKILSIILVIALCLTSLPTSPIADGIEALKNAIAAMAAEQEEENFEILSEITIQTVDDFISLSEKNPGAYQNAVIKIAPTGGELTLTDADSEGRSFLGLGNEKYPFKGSITYSANVNGYITLNRALFNYLDQSAVVGTESAPLNLQAANNSTSALLAENFVNDSGTEQAAAISLNISAYSEDDTISTFGGIIGTMNSASALTLTINNKIAAGETTVTGTGNRGLFCNTMESGSKLTIASYTGNGDMNFTVTATGTGSAAGAFVGEMKENASLTLTLESATAYSGTVTGAAAAGGVVGKMGTGASLSFNNTFTMSGAVKGAVSAGGLIGDGTNVVISTNGKIKINSAAIGGSNASGGVVGTYVFRGAAASAFDLSKFEIDSSAFQSGTYAGGIFGMLSNQSAGQEFTIYDAGYSNQQVAISSFDNVKNNYGGLIGMYEAKTAASADTDSTYNLESALVIKELAVSSKLSSDCSSYGGLIAKVSEKSYIEIADVTVTTDKNGNALGSYGGAAAYAGASIFFNIGNIKVTGDYTASTVSGGLVGNSASGVIRLHGTTDLTSSAPKDTTKKTGQIIGNRNDTLVYAVGDGNTAAGTSGDDSAAAASNDWLLKRCSSVYVSDIGDWGEVIRVNGETLRETTDETDTTALLYRNGHTVTIQGIVSGEGAVNEVNCKLIKSVSEFAAYALSFQFNASESLIISNTVSDSEKISIEADIPLSGTGLTGFTRDSMTGVNDNNQNKCKFRGLLTSSGNYKISLATGELYGYRGTDPVTADTVGSGQIYDHAYLGLFGQKTGLDKTCTVSNITIGGTVDFGLVNNGSAVYVGAVSGYQPYGSDQTYKQVQVETTITYHNNTGDSVPTAYVGGIVGYIRYASTVTISECTFSGTINNQATSWKFYNAGLIAYAENNNNQTQTITVEKTTIGGKLSVSNASTDHARVGGVLASIGCSRKTTITLKDINIAGLTIESKKATDTSGGFLGYEWRNADVTITGLNIQNSNLTTGALFGGLVYEASGKWEISSNSNTESGQYTSAGIEYGAGVSISGKTDTTNPSALLVARGDNYVYSSDTSSTYEYALYLTIQDAEAYKVDLGTSVTLTNASSASETYFDEIVGRSITAETIGKNGVVSIATADADGDGTNDLIDQSACNTYKAQLSTTYSNPNTRYYYNLDSLSTNKADSTITSGTELLLWSVGQYCENNLYSYFTNSHNADITIQGTIDLTGLSYYPIDYTGAAVTIEDAAIIYDYAQIEQTETTSTNKLLSDANSQHYMMQTGLFDHFTSSTSKAASITIKGEQGLTLKGTIGQLASADEYGGSGALICGIANGAVNGTTINTFSFSTSKLVLDALKVYNVDDYAPLLINEIGSYSSLSITNVTTQNYPEGTKAATSLIGHVGSETDQNIVLLFENIDLDGRTATSIFTRATLLESFSYDLKDVASSGTYNFNQDDTATYGQELSNGVNSNGTTGRNPYNADEGTGQVWYYDTFGSSEDGAYVTDAANNTSAHVGSGFFTEEYLRYVYVPEGDDGKEWRHEIDINQLVVDILKGCGTYDDPYIIDENGQLESLATFLSTGSIAGWNINICYDVAKNQKSLASHNTTGSEDATVSENTTDTDGSTDSEDSSETAENEATYHYLYTSGSTWTTTSSTDEVNYDLNSDEVRAYLRNAYYMVTEDLTLSSSFYGLGGSDPNTNVFSGVIVGTAQDDGSYPTISVSAHSGNSHNYFGGLIAFSNGSVVKNITIDYSEAALELTAKAPSQERADQSFFGGVIGYVVGGDNIIDNVQVTGLDSFALTIYGTDAAENGTYANLTPVGAYVGLIGGNTESGGGVIFRNMDSSAGFSGSDFDENSDYYYRNPYVGRVLDGYAMAEDCTVANTDKNYTIPTIASSEGKIQVTAPASNKSTITIANAQQLWVLSAIVNSGAGGKSKTNDNKFNTDAYNYGCVRTGSYASVGTNSATEEDISDCNYWGGRGYSESAKKSYLVYKYAEEYASYVSGGDYSYSITFTSDCNMTEYGNGFRGIGTAYQDNAPASDSTSKIIRMRTIYIGESVSGSCEKNADDSYTNTTITIKRNVKEYASEQGTESTPGWWTQGIGLFPALNFKSATVIQNLTISGEAQIAYAGDEDYIGEASAGGFAGFTANGSANVAVTFTNVDLKDLIVSGSKYSGGLVGVYGQSSRTVSGKLKIELGSMLGNVIFNQCDYDHITITGGYSAGGYFGTYKSSGTTTLTGPCSYKNSTIRWNNDACLEMYTVTKDTNSKTYGYSGGGGLIGYYNAGDFKINVNGSDQQTLEFNGLQISGPQFAYNCDYGLGALTGLQQGGIMYANYVNATDVTVKINIDENYTTQFKKYDLYYLTPAAGVLVGYGNVNTNFNYCNIYNSKVLNAGMGGGYVGSSRTGPAVTVTNSEMKNTLVYSIGTACFDGSTKAGGICGGAKGKVTVKNVYLENVDVISDGRSALIVGHTNTSGSQEIQNFYAKGCTVSTTQDEQASYIIGNNSDPGDRSSTSKGTDSSAGAAGIIVGSVSASGKFTNVNSMKVFNMLIDGCIIGYYTGNPLSSETDVDSLTLDETTIGVYTGTNAGIPYSNLIGNNAMSSSNTYTEGSLGKLIGGASSISSMQVVGLSIQGEYYPYYENGYGKKNVGVTDSTGNYVIYADYTGASAGENPNTSGTINATYTTTTNASSPYVVVNPSSGINVYGKATGTSNQALLTGDALSQTAIDSIINDLTSTTASATHTANLRYNHVSKIAQDFSGTGQYAEYLTKYLDASESDSSVYGDTFSDFPVLLLDTTSSTEITERINAYISLLTNCDQTGTGTTAIRYSGVSVQTYQWNSTNNRFVAVATNANTLTYTNNTFSVNGTNHDNQLNQFTLLDVKYQNKVTTGQYYHLYIPVVVKKVLQFDFSVKMLTGSSTYDSIYSGNEAVLASYGENFTAQLSYNYTWTAAEWNTYIATGNSMLWSYDKQVQLDQVSEQSDLNKETTRYTLADVNRYGQGNTYFTANGSALEINEQSTDQSSALLKFSSLTESGNVADGFQSVYICDLLSLQVAEDENGALKKVGSGGPDDEIPDGASIRVWDQTEAAFIYYGPKSSSDSSDTTYYTLTLVNALQEAYEDTVDVTISEVYYLIINCEDGEGVYSRILSLGEKRMTSADSKAVPTKTVTNSSRAASKYYTLGDFFEISDTSISSTSENSSAVIELGTNDYIDVEVSAKVSVAEDQAEIFKNYASGTSSYFRFALRLSDGSSFCAINATSISVEDLKIGDQTLASEDYTIEQIAGICYVTITGQTASEYQNQTVYAKLRFSYMDDSEKISEQFPERVGESDQDGIHFSVDAAIAYTKDSLDGTKMSDSDQDATYYYREKIEVVDLTYNSYNTASEDGNTSQLGINGREAAGNSGQTITSLGMFNATQLTSLNLTDREAERYPASLVCTLSLEKKTDQSDGSTKYEPVKIDTYLDDITVTSGDNSVSGAVNKNGAYGFTVLLSDEQIQNIALEQIEMDISYFVLSDAQLEAVEANGVYSNYRVTLTAYLANANGEKLAEETSDYFVYTNAKFYLGILGNSDFGN